MAREAGAPPPDIERLKALLLGDEAAKIARLDVRLAALDRYVGDAPKLETATADIITQALRRAEATRHRELSNAIAPVVVSVIRNEIKNSKDMMVEALYPITGRLVAAGIANAIRDLMAALNQRLDKLTSTDGLKLRLRAALQGKKVSELALAEAQQARITRILFLERGSGTLVANWQLDGGASDQADLVSGLIAAITEFAASALVGQGGQLRTLDLGSSRVILRTSPRMIIAATCEGALRPAEEQALDAAFLRLLELHDGGATNTDAMLGDVAASIAAPVVYAPKSSGKALYVIGALAAAALLWWGAAAGLAARKTSQLRAAFSAALAADTELAAYPLRLQISGASGDVLLEGLAPDLERVETIAARLRPLAFPQDVKVNVARVAPASALAQQDGGLRALAAQTAESARQSEIVRRQARDDSAAQEKQIAELRVALSLSVSELRGALAAAQARMASDAVVLRQRLDTADAITSQKQDALDAKQDVLDAKQAAIAVKQDALGVKIDALQADVAGAADRLAIRAGGLEQRFATNSAAFDALAEKLGAAEAVTVRLRAEVEGVAPQMRDVIARETGDIRTGLGESDARAAAIQIEIATLQRAFEALRAQLAGLAASLPEAEAREINESEARIAAERARLEAIAKAEDAGRTRVDGVIGSLAVEAEKRAALEARLDSQREANASETEALRNRVGLLEAALAQALARIPTPLARLKEAMARDTIYFIRDTELDGAAQALANISEIAELAKAAGARLRVVGHTDAVGDAAKNLQLALKRANFIVGLLAARGVDPKLLATASRGSAELVVIGQSGGQLLSRRVTFEIIEGE